MGNVILAATSTKSSGSSAYLLIGIVVLFGLLYFVTIRPQRRRQQQAQQTQRNVEIGSRVRTTAGMYATVVGIEDQDVILEVAPGVDVRYMRRAIMEVLPDGEPETDYSEEADDEPEDSAEDMPEDSAEDAPDHSPEARSKAEGDAATG
jgi:preprotein translocase YajC subunit